jgi:acetyl-CoA C-acetyltransferase
VSVPTLAPTDAVIVAAARTPIGRAARGALADVRAEDLFITAARGALDRASGLSPATLDDVIVGAWLQVGDQGSNLARRIGVLMGWDAVSGTTVNRACTSSLQALAMASHAIRSGEGQAFLVGGVESISHYAQRRTAGTTADDAKHPALRAVASRYRAQLEERAPMAPWRDPRADGEIPDVHLAMGLTAENVAQHRGITRADQDAYALLSQERTAAAVASGFFTREIAPVTTEHGVVATDDCPRPGTSAAGLSALQPAFVDDGTVTAGNCCPLADGAAALVVTSADRAARDGVVPLARVVATATSALSPEIMGLGPVEATARALQRAGMTPSDLDLVELNEAFAAQVLPCIDDIGVDHERVNVFGGAIALGHPYGMGGARLTTTLLNGMQHTDATVGLVTMCAAGGQGMAVVLERMT